MVWTNIGYVLPVFLWMHIYTPSGCAQLDTVNQTLTGISKKRKKKKTDSSSKKKNSCTKT